MAKTIRYFYDEENCTFKEEKLTPISALKKTLNYLAVSGLLTVAVLAAYFFLYDDPKDLFLKRQNQELQSQIKSWEGQFATLELQIDGLQERDRDFYRSLMGSEPISAGIWNGGIGGSANISEASHSEYTREVNRRLDQIGHKVELQGKSFDLMYSMLAGNNEYLSHVPAIKPVKGRIISGFGMRMHPILKFRRMHTGLDLEAVTGTEVRATGDGIVKSTKRLRNGYGTHIIIDHGEAGFQSLYGHLSEIVVKSGQRVKRGDLIGYSGNSGLSKGPHLHYEIIQNKKKINPIAFFYADLSPEEYAEHRQHASEDNTTMD